MIVHLHFPTDIVFCIDVTHSMRNHINNIKEIVLNFKDDLLRSYREFDSTGSFRFKIITFGNEKIGEILQVTSFYAIPEQEATFRTVVNDLEIVGNEDDSESSGYEALKEAFKSDWKKDKPYDCVNEESWRIRYRWITVLFTDSPAYYDSEKLNSTLNAWNSLDYSKRLLIFAPDHASWSVFAGKAQSTLFYPSKAGEGLEEHDKNAIIDTLRGGI